jgi:hypothetical protein
MTNGNGGADSDEPSNQYKKIQTKIDYFLDRRESQCPKDILDSAGLMQDFIKLFSESFN